MSDSTVLQYILIPMLMTVATHFLSRLENINIDSIKTLFTEFKWENFGKKSNSVFLTGERIRSVCHYSGESNVVESFTKLGYVSSSTYSLSVSVSSLGNDDTLSEVLLKIL